MIQQRQWKDWTSFRSHCCTIHHILSTSHLSTSPLLVGTRTQCEVNNSKHQKLFEYLYRIYASIWIPARISQCTANGWQNLKNWSRWLRRLIITMPLKFDCTQRTELEVGMWKLFGIPICWIFHSSEHSKHVPDLSEILLLPLLLLPVVYEITNRYEIAVSLKDRIFMKIWV
jgi:hypothetical protein